MFENFKDRLFSINNISYHMNAMKRTFASVLAANWLPTSKNQIENRQ
jgi:hypothetical protein